MWKGLGSSPPPTRKQSIPKCSCIQDERSADSGVTSKAKVIMGYCLRHSIQQDFLKRQAPSWLITMSSLSEPEQQQKGIKIKPHSLRRKLGKKARIQRQKKPRYIFTCRKKLGWSNNIDRQPIYVPTII